MSAMLVAVTVTLPAVAGAVYVADVIVEAGKLPPPVTDQLTPAAPTSFVTVAVKFMLWPIVSPPRTGVIATDNPDTTAVCTVIVAVPVFVPSATDVAVNVTVAGDGTVAGAVYVIATPDALVVADSAPHVAPEHPVPASVQFTPLFCASLLTVAVKFCVKLTVTVAVVGATATEIAGSIVIVAEKLFVPSATEVAVMLTVAGDGTLAGAVYVIATPDALELAESVPQVLPLHPVPLSVQFTPLFCESFVTVAVKLCVFVTFTLADVGAMATEIAGSTVIVAEKLFVPSATEVAVMLTAAGEGTAAGAV